VQLELGLRVLSHRDPYNPVQIRVAPHPRPKKDCFRMGQILAFLAVVLMLSTGAVAVSRYKVLYRFKAGDDGAFPQAGLIMDVAGNLYGTTNLGGSQGGCGTVFKLTPNSDGSWTESVLHRFSPTDGQGCIPSASLVFDQAGNLYSTTGFGGTSNEGTVFRLTPNSDGSWTYSVLHSFTGVDGAYPQVALIFDAAGNLYSTTGQGGTSGFGTVFKLKRNEGGNWTESVLYNFCSLTSCADGANPVSNLIVDPTGSLYGATFRGGASGSGTVFRLKQNTHGSWTESVLHSFTGSADGAFPVGGLIFDVDGNLYGTTGQGGASGVGTVFRLKQNTHGSWTERVLHNFADPTTDPLDALIFDAVGNLYGTASGLGGAAFKLTHNSNGSWGYSVLHHFLGKPAGHPYDSLVLDNAGNLFGTAHDCGENCYGVVFEVTP
jgi:uncharacterized repeat protein (TIGR03803 family)